ncbi:unnamed protein product [Menidia menidia]|uniref:(Atlantic silverside) hypothetical protein n=1 Tax=Menidia menidia TaxID=238744 RepID=A0A8S4BT84_9TELE|nr:unnamed protein product [Menidia menidia]
MISFPSESARLRDKKEEMNYEFGRESGFINSQPSLAECLTSFTNPVGDAFQSSSIKSSALSRSTLIPPPFEQTVPGLCPSVHPRHGRAKQAVKGCSPLRAASLPPEYPERYFHQNTLTSQQCQNGHNGDNQSPTVSILSSNEKNLKHFPNPTPTVPMCPPTIGPDNEGSSGLDASLQDFHVFSPSPSFSPSFSESIQSPLPLSSETFDLFSETLTTMDLQNLSY